jgi:hypothetical protein
MPGAIFSHESIDKLGTSSVEGSVVSHFDGFSMVPKLKI